MHATIRRFKGASKLIAELERRGQEVENIVSSTPGFVAYHAVRSGDTLVSITVCLDRNGTDETTRRSTQWIRENFSDDVVIGLTPEITDGEDFLTFQTPQRLNTTSRTFNTANTNPTNEATL